MNTCAWNWAVFVIVLHYVVGQCVFFRVIIWQRSHITYIYIEYVTICTHECVIVWNLWSTRIVNNSIITGLRCKHTIFYCLDVYSRTMRTCLKYSIKFGMPKRPAGRTNSHVCVLFALFPVFVLYNVISPSGISPSSSSSPFAVSKLKNTIENSTEKNNSRAAYRNGPTCEPKRFQIDFVPSKIPINTNWCVRFARGVAAVFDVAFGLRGGICMGTWDSHTDAVVVVVVVCADKNGHRR